VGFRHLPVREGAAIPRGWPGNLFPSVVNLGLHPVNSTWELPQSFPPVCPKGFYKLPLAENLSQWFGNRQSGRIATIAKEEVTDFSSHNDGFSASIL
jgi:hypothetical protein